MRAAFALLRTPVATEPKRSQECERGTQECVRYGCLRQLCGGQRALITDVDWERGRGVR